MYRLRFRTEYKMHIAGAKAQLEKVKNCSDVSPSPSFQYNHYEKQEALAAKSFKTPENKKGDWLKNSETTES